MSEQLNALKLALEAVEWIAQQRTGGMIQRKSIEAITAIKQAIEAPMQEPYWLIAPNGEYYKNPKHLMNQATPPAQTAPVPLTDEEIDAATKAWFENDIVSGNNLFRKRMRAAFAAAHGITKGQS